MSRLARLTGRPNQSPALASAGPRAMPVRTCGIAGSASTSWRSVSAVSFMSAHEVARAHECDETDEGEAGM